MSEEKQKASLAISATDESSIQTLSKARSVSPAVHRTQRGIMSTVVEVSFRNPMIWVWKPRVIGPLATQAHQALV